MYILQLLHLYMFKYKLVFDSTSNAFYIFKVLRGYKII